MCVGYFGGGLVPQEQGFARQGFFVVPKTEQDTSIIPLRVRHHLGGGLGHRALFAVPGRVQWFPERSSNDFWRDGGKILLFSMF